MPDAQFDAAVWLIRHLQGTFGNIAPRGHGEMSGAATACPGRFFPLAEMKRLQYRGSVPTQPPAPPPSTPGAPAPQLFRVQVGAFKVRANADAKAARLRALGHETIIVERGGYIRVQVGAFAQRPNADRLAATLKSQGFSTFVTT
jgi:cell division septation protein DedD